MSSRDREAAIASLTESADRLLAHAEAMVEQGQADTLPDALAALQRALSEPMEA